MAREYFDKKRDIQRDIHSISRKRPPVIHGPDRRKYSNVSFMDREREITTKDFFEYGEGVHKISIKHPVRPKRHHRGEKRSNNPLHQEKRDGLSHKKIELGKQDKLWLNQQIRDALSPHLDDSLNLLEDDIFFSPDPYDEVGTYNAWKRGEIDNNGDSEEIYVPEKIADMEEAFGVVIVEEENDRLNRQFNADTRYRHPNSRKSGKPFRG